MTNVLVHVSRRSNRDPILTKISVDETEADGQPIDVDGENVVEVPRTLWDRYAAATRLERELRAAILERVGV